MILQNPQYCYETLMLLGLEHLASQNRDEFYPKLVAGLQSAGPAVGTPQEFQLKNPLLVDPQYDVKLM